MTPAWKEVLTDCWFFVGKFWPMLSAMIGGVILADGDSGAISMWSFILLIFSGVLWMIFWVNT